MSSRLGEITAQAHDLVATGDLAGAQELLGQALAHADPRPAAATPDLTEAAGLQARILVTLGDPHTARGWAAFAYAAATRLHGPSDPRTVAAAATLAAVLHRVGSHARAAHLYRDVIIELTATDGPESLRVLAAHADLATVEYARGDCGTARTRLADAWELHREVYGDGNPAGIRMLARLGAMERDCRLSTEAQRHFALARELCRQYLPPDHALVGQVAALAEAAADPDHVCGDEGADFGPGPATPDPAPTVPDPRSAQYWTHPHEAAVGVDSWAGTSGPDPSGAPPPTGEYPAAAPNPVPPPRLPPAPPASPPELAGPAEPADQFGTGYYPDLTPDSAAEDGYRYRAEPDPTGYRAESALAVPDRHGDDGWTDPDRHGPTGEAVWTRETDGVHQVRHLPERRSNRLPVRRESAGRGRSLLPIVLAGLVVVVLGAVAVIAGFGRVDRDRTPAPRDEPRSDPGSATAPAPTPTPAPASPGTPPGEVTLTDSSDSVTLSWIYPAGAEGPVVVSGGRAGQSPRAFQELPAGSTDYVVYGLPAGTDYCFIVAVVWSTDVIGRAEPVCTSRASRSPTR